MGLSPRNKGSVGAASRGENFPSDYAKSTSRQYDFSRNNDPFSRVHSSLSTEDVPNAASEKELVGAIPVFFFFPAFFLYLFWVRGLKGYGCQHSNIFASIHCCYPSSC